MRQRSNQDEALRRYLLGQLQDVEQDAIDDRLLMDDDYFERLEMIEDELIDDYVSGTLSDAERQAFGARFLATPEGKKKLNFALAMHKYARNNARITSDDGTIVDGGTTADNRITADGRAGDNSGGGLQAIRDVPKIDLDSQTPPNETPTLDRKGRSVPNRGPAIRFASGPYLKIAASLVLVAGLGAITYRMFFYQSDVDKGLVLLRELHSTQRPFDARLSDFSYAQHIETRGGESQTASDVQIKRDQTEILLVDAYQQDRSAKTNHALGEFYLADKQVDKAIPYLESAVKASDSNAAFHNDLGVALLEKGKLEKQGQAGNEQSSGSSSPGVATLTRSLPEFNRALELDPNFLPALFNRALCWQELGESAKARDAWGAYLEKDSKSEWAGEARRKIAEAK